MYILKVSSPARVDREDDSEQHGNHEEVSYAESFLNHVKRVKRDNGNDHRDAGVIIASKSRAARGLGSFRVRFSCLPWEPERSSKRADDSLNLMRRNCKFCD